MGHPAPAQILCVGKFQPHGRGWGQAPAAQPPLPGQSRFRGKSQLACAGPGSRLLGPAAGQRFPAAGKSLRENRLLPTPARPRPAALSRGDGRGDARTRRDPLGIAASGFCSPGATGTDAHPRVSPGPRPAPLSSPGKPEAAMMDVLFPGLTRPEQPSTWRRSQGPPPSPGTCRAARAPPAPDTDPAAARAGAIQGLLQQTPGPLPGGPVWCRAVLGADKHP